MSEIRPRKDKDLFVKDVPPFVMLLKNKREIYTNIKKKTRTYWRVRAKRKLGDR